jgi:hypothetical protein
LWIAREIERQSEGERERDGDTQTQANTIVAFMLSVLSRCTEKQIEPIEPVQHHHRTYTEFHRTNRTVVYYI